MTKTRATTIDPAAAHDFLTGFHLAIVGASDEPKNFGRTVLRALRAHGYDVVTVNPTVPYVDGEQCYPSVRAVPGHLDGVIMMVNANTATDIVRACASRGVEKVWLFKGLSGPGAASADVVALCDELGIAVIPGACPLMFLPPANGMHHLHRALRRLNGSLLKGAPERSSTMTTGGHDARARLPRSR